MPGVERGVFPSNPLADFTACLCGAVLGGLCLSRLGKVCPVCPGAGVHGQPPSPCLAASTEPELFGASGPHARLGLAQSTDPPFVGEESGARACVVFVTVYSVGFQNRQGSPTQTRRCPWTRLFPRRAGGLARHCSVRSDASFSSACH